jgi:biopolymer transport protein ExbD/biopolymer transport protein TolR
MDVGGKGGKRVRSEINVTPLVDVVLVLLIIFMVVTPMLQRGQAVQLPRASQVSNPDSGDSIAVAVTRDGRIWLDRTEVARQDLAEALAREVARAPGLPVVLKGDKDLDYRTVRQVILELSKTRISGVSLAAREPGAERGP